MQRATGSSLGAALGALLALGPATNAHGVVIKLAGERAGHWEASLMLNWVEAQTLHVGSGQAQTDASYGWGIGIHYNFDNHFSLGLDVANNRPGYRLDFPDPEDPEATVTVDHTAYRFDGQFNGVYHILKGDITPYLQAGLGWTYLDSNIVESYRYYCGPPHYYPYCQIYADTFDETAFSWNAGIGLRWDVTDAAFVRGAVIQQWLGSDGGPAPLNARVEVGMKF